MNKLEFVYSSGGRGKYYHTFKVGDCVTRAIANATGMDYKEVYNLMLKRNILLRKNNIYQVQEMPYLRILSIGYY